jgi:hypothetical protein
MPSAGAMLGELERLEQRFNERARYRFQRHAAPDEDGVTRWRCPFCAGLLRSRQLPKTMRKSRENRALVTLPDGSRCCSGTLSLAPSELPYWQRLPAGTTAWRISMGRRQVAESANAGLKGGFVNIARKFFRVFGSTKMTILLAFTVVGYNLDRKPSPSTGG